MKDRIEKELSRLKEMRDSVLNIYLDDLSTFSSKQGSMLAINSAGILHDLDRHITNLELELKRIGALNLIPKEATNGK